MRMDNEVLDELLGFLAGGDDAAEGADEWLFPMDMLEAPRPALEGGGGGVSMALASPRRDCPYEIHERDDSDEVQDAQDDRSAGSSGSDASGHHAQQLQAEPRVATKKRRTRKQEIQTLHDHVAQLTTELNALKTEAGIDLSTPVARVPKTCRELGGEKRADTLCLWEKLAARQLSKRLVSEKQNRALREAVITHVRRAKRLRLMLLKRAREERMALAGTTPQTRSASVVFMPVIDDDLFRSLAAGMDSLYADVDAALERGGLNVMARPGRSSNVKRVGPENWFVELRNVNVLPFDYQRTGRAVWRLQAGEAATEDRNESKQRFKFMNEYLQGVTFRIRMTTVSHRHVEENRVVIIGRSVIEPTPGIRVDHTTRIVVQPGPPSVAGPTTEVVTYQTGDGTISLPIQKMFDGKIDLNSPNYDFGVGLWEKAVARTEDSLESMLLAEAVGAS